MDKSSQTLLIIFIGIAALSILAQAAFTVGMFLGLRKTQKKLLGLADDFRLHALPVIISARETVQDLAPKLKVITENLTAASTTLRSKTDQIGGLVGDVTNRAQSQASRVDGMVKGTLDQLTMAVSAIEHGVAVPLRQVNGILNGLRAGVDVLRKKTPADQRNPEDDLFV